MSASSFSPVSVWRVKLAYDIPKIKWRSPPKDGCNWSRDAPAGRSFSGVFTRRRGTPPVPINGKEMVYCRCDCFCRAMCSDCLINGMIILRLKTFQSISQLCTNPQAGFAEDGVSRDFHVSNTIAILAISFFIFGLGLGPLFMGPLSEIYGRNLVYRISYTIFFLLNWPVAFAPNICEPAHFTALLLLNSYWIDVHLVFRFIAGVTGSAFLSVAGGTVSDLFNDRAVARSATKSLLFPIWQGMLVQWPHTLYVLSSDPFWVRCLAGGWLQIFWKRGIQ